MDGDQGTTCLVCPASSHSIRSARALALYVVTSAGLFQDTPDSEDAAAETGSPVYSGQKLCSIRNFAIDPQNSGTIYAAVGTPGVRDGGVFKTADGGTTWNEADSGFPGVPISSLAVGPQNQGVIYAANGGSLLKTTDAGAHWIRGAVKAWKVVVEPLDSSVAYTPYPYRMVPGAKSSQEQRMAN